jgi:hypothetical protein
MRKALLSLWLLVLAAVPFFGQTDEWKRHKNAEGNFSVLFPGDPQDSVNKADAEVQSHTLMLIQKPYVYTVVYSAMTSAQKVDDATYEIFKTAVFKELPKCDVNAERPPVPVISGYIGHWYRLSCEMPNTKVTILGNLYWGKHYAYAVMVMFPSSADAPQTTSKFLESFGIIDLNK